MVMKLELEGGELLPVAHVSDTHITFAQDGELAPQQATLDMDGRKMLIYLNNGIVGRSAKYEYLAPVEGKVANARPTDELLRETLHSAFSHPWFEYKTTQGPRKNWNGDPDLTKEGWEENEVRGEHWAREEFHEERYWRRRKLDG